MNICGTRVLCDLCGGANVPTTKFIRHITTPAVGLLQMKAGQCTIAIVAFSGLTVKVLQPLLIEVRATTQFYVLWCVGA